MIVRSSIVVILTAILVSGCTGSHLAVRKLPLNSGSYASTFAKTPDQNRVNLGDGERLYVDWRLPFSMNPKDYNLVLSVVYKDLSEESISIPLLNRIGGYNFPLVGDKLKSSKGFLTYKIDLVTPEGEVADSWEQAMWVKVIH